ncbi:HAMP domain-containing sensor histidine kinase [Desulfobulbus sp.]|uniref:sensor histidine kinase n=1 Tax=Desulfobulbus sp. TaxID=895 RepID=UPI00286F779C|nr:HAMP domain-containing sensor histidine kinase [Desulfobulbus sp.]
MTGQPTNPQPPCIPPDLEAVCLRVREKAESYEQYNFSRGRNDFLKAFFDLAQEYDSLDDFYRICVSVPLALVGVASSLYLCEDCEHGLQLVCSSEEGVLSEPRRADYPVQMQETPYDLGGSYVIPIFSKQPFPRKIEDRNAERQMQLWDDLHGLCGSGRILGMFEVRRKAGLTEADKFFFAKYTNRIGYNLDNRLIARQNIERLKFINTLVIDIEHNIIVPNMYFRHLFNQLKKRIGLIEELRREMDANRDGAPLRCSFCNGRLRALQDDLVKYHQEIVKHHANMSLFIESLFRREHFERGHLVLHPKRCFVEKEVILPQLDHYASRLQAANVMVDRPQNMYEEEFPLMVDIGLLSQVYANLFSNAAKYTKEVVDHRGQSRKAMAYGREIVDNFPVAGKKGVKFNVFTTGPGMTVEQGNRLFQEGMRGDDNPNIPGTGHGLSFIRLVVEMHGGSVGYESTPEGNNFYFILPLPPVDYPVAPYRRPE